MVNIFFIVISQANYFELKRFDERLELLKWSIITVSTKWLMPLLKQLFDGDGRTKIYDCCTDYSKNGKIKREL